MAGATDDLRRVHDRVQRQADAAGRPRGLTPAILEHARSLALKASNRRGPAHPEGARTATRGRRDDPRRPWRPATRGPGVFLDADDADVDTLAAALAADPAQLRQLRDGLADRLPRPGGSRSSQPSAMYGALLRAGLGPRHEIVEAGAEAVALVSGGTRRRSQSIVQGALAMMAPARIPAPASTTSARTKLDLFDEPDALLPAVRRRGLAGSLRLLQPDSALDRAAGAGEGPGRRADRGGRRRARGAARAVPALRHVGRPGERRRRRRPQGRDDEGAGDRGDRGNADQVDDLVGPDEIDYAYSDIRTGAPGDFFATGGADDNAVSLTIIDRNGTAYDITPRIGWYDDGDRALGWTPVPDINLFDFDHIRLLYTSTNDGSSTRWCVRLSYKPDQKIDAILRPDQLSHDPSAPNQTTWDLVLGPGRRLGRASTTSSTTSPARRQRARHGAQRDRGAARAGSTGPISRSTRSPRTTSSTSASTSS